MSPQALSTLTLKFRGVEAALLEEMVESGLHNTKAEAVRSSLVNYGLQLGLLGRHELWERMKARRRGVTPEQLDRELKELEAEA